MQLKKKNKRRAVKPWSRADQGQVCHIMKVCTSIMAQAIMQMAISFCFKGAIWIFKIKLWQTDFWKSKEFIFGHVYLTMKYFIVKPLGQTRDANES